ncbi:MAG: anti-sigma factor antagonist [Lachnospiraceae bacterium]|nr:anti-sigma factor antagonist [Lachnospiraceae bacterium]
MSKLKISLEGRIDSNNAPAVEKELSEKIGEQDGREIALDVEKLTYISSAGLRVLMKLRKKVDHPIEILNVNRDIYDIFETTGFTELFDVKKAYRTVNVDGLEVIGRGFFGTVYRIDAESIVKVYKGKESIPKIENEKKMAQKAFVSGIPTAISYDIVKVGEDYGSVFELLNARTFHELAQSEAMPLPELIAKYTELLKIVHSTRLEKGTFPSYREKFLEYLEVIAKHLTEKQYDGLKKLLTDMDDENTVVHGDIQMKNVMMVDGEPMLIDMDTLGLGNPVFEFAGLYMTYQAFEEDDPDNSMSFLEMSNEFVDDLWNRIVDSYFVFPDAAHRKETLAKIALASAIRFLSLIESTDLKEGDLGRKRIAHTLEHIDELLDVVTDLTI